VHSRRAEGHGLVLLPELWEDKGRQDGEW
jgi:hypothetical protein